MSDVRIEGKFIPGVTQTESEKSSFRRAMFALYVVRVSNIRTLAERARIGRQ
jgi:hypothetical protein